MLPALTGLRAFTATNIVFFHFWNPAWFGPLAPLMDNGYVGVNFFFFYQASSSPITMRTDMQAGNSTDASSGRHAFPACIPSICSALQSPFQFWNWSGAFGRTHNFFRVSRSRLPCNRAGVLLSRPSGTRPHGRSPVRSPSI